MAKLRTDQKLRIFLIILFQLFQASFWVFITVSEILIYFFIWKETTLDIIKWIQTKISEMKSILQVWEYHKTAIQDYNYQNTPSKLSGTGIKATYTI